MRAWGPRPQQVFFHLREGLAQVEVGFSWPAFFFGSLWAAAKRMWWPAFALMLVLDAGLWLLTLAAEAGKHTGLAFTAVGAALLHAFVRGCYGNRWHAASLRRRGYTLHYVVSDPQTARTAREWDAQPLVVRDCEEALAFYRDVLGFHWAGEATSARGQRQLLLRPGHGTNVLVTEAWSRRPLAPSGEKPGFSLRTLDCRGYCEELRAQGVKIVKEPEVEPERGLVAVFADPSGNLWELVQGRWY